MENTLTKTLTFEWRDTEVLVNEKSFSFDSVAIRINEGKLSLHFEVSTADYLFLRNILGWEWTHTIILLSGDFEDVGPSRSWPVDKEIQEIWFSDREALPF